jgi:hypothetical protein
MHMLMCLVMSVVIAFYRAIRTVCLHDVSMIPIGVEGAHQEEEEPSHRHVVQETSIPHEPSQLCQEATYHRYVPRLWRHTPLQM